MDASDLAYAGISAQAQLIRAGEISSAELVAVYLERIARLDTRLNAFRSVFAERVTMEAKQADARRAGGDERALLGVPIAIKDDIDVAGELTAIGTNAVEQPAPADAEVVRRLREAGALVIGKTNVPELTQWPFTETATYGATRNPWDLQRSPGGSSGGSAAAVAAGLVGAALAGDGGGSIRIPSAFSGLFGLKTQWGRVPLAPQAGAWHGLVVYGVLTRSVRDSALFYDAIADGPADPDTPVVPPSSFLDALGQTGPLKIAMASRLPPSPLTKLNAENRAALEQTAALLRDLGHEVNEHEVDYGQLAPAAEFTVVYLRSLYETVSALAHPERVERRIGVLARIGGMIPQGVLDWALGRRAQYTARLNEPLADHDLLLTPVTPATAPRIGAREGRGWLRTSVEASATVPYVACWNLTGQPACSVPAGFDDDGLPRAVQLVGKPNDEATLVALAAQLEAERPWTQDRPPAFS
jgi:amidase